MELLRRYSKLQSVTPTLGKAVQLSQWVTLEPLQAPAPEVRVAHRLSQRLSRTTLVEMIHCYQEGATAQETAKRYGISKGSAIRVLAEYGVLRSRVAPTEGQVAKAAELYARGMSLEAAGQQVGLSASYLCRVFKERGITTRRPWDHML